MNARQWDELTRAIGRTGSRRALLGGLLASAAAPLAVNADPWATGAGADAGGAKKKKPRKCPLARRCATKCCPAGKSCASGSACVTPCNGANCGAFPATCSLLPPDNIWNARVDTLPVDAKSNAYVNAIGASTNVHPDFGAGNWDGGPIGIPFIVKTGSPPMIRPRFDYADESDPGPYPMPPNAPIEGGPGSDGDRHILVIDPASCTLFELYDAHPGTGANWRAGSGAIFDLASNDLRPAGWTSADAAGLPVFPGLVRYEEVAAGAINHALRFTVPRTRNAYVWPARHRASNDNNPNLPPMGQRFRLKASVNISGFSGNNQVILRALKQYGMMLADNGSAWYLSGVPDPRWNNDELRALQSLRGSDFEAVDVSSLMQDPDSGRVS